MKPGPELAAVTAVPITRLRATPRPTPREPRRTRRSSPRRTDRSSRRRMRRLFPRRMCRLSRRRTDRSSARRTCRLGLWSMPPAIRPPRRKTWHALPGVPSARVFSQENATRRAPGRTTGRHVRLSVAAGLVACALQGPSSADSFSLSSATQPVSGKTRERLARSSATVAPVPLARRRPSNATALSPRPATRPAPGSRQGPRAPGATHVRRQREPALPSRTTRRAATGTPAPLVTPARRASAPREPR